MSERAHGQGKGRKMRRVFSGLGLLILLMGTLTLAFNVQPAKTSSATYTRIYLPNEWISDGVAMGWHADDSSWSYILPFDFPFYGTYYTTIYISSNGLITFTGPDSGYSNSISGLSGKLAVTPAWDDWETNAPHDIYIWQPDSSHVIFRWEVAALYNSDTAANFEVILGSDGVIQFNYGQNNGLISATVGISNGAGEILAEDATDLNYINTILFTPFRPEHDLEVRLEAPTFLAPDRSTILNATVSNLGSNNETSVELQLLINGTVVDSDIIPDLLTGSSHTLSYPWTPANEGLYNVTAYASPVTDETIIENNMATKWVNVLTIERIFREDFNTPTLDPHWQVWRYSIPAPSPPEATYQQETRYSLTDNPGYLRCYLGSMTSWGINEPQWNGPGSPYWYYPSMHLYRMFEGTDWMLETKVTYISPYANAPISVTYIFFGDPWQGQGWKDNSIVIIGGAWDAYHQVYVIENGTWKGPTNLPMNQYGDTFYYRVTRLGHQFTFEWSRDSITFTTAFTETIGSQIDGLPQGVGITGQAFSSDTSTYSEYDHIYLAPPPEHELAVSLEAPNFIMPGRSSCLNATVYNHGLGNETDVELQLLINGTEVESVVIPQLPQGSLYTLSYFWAPAIEGIYNVTAYAPPVPGENITDDNWKIEFVGVFEMVKVVILDSWGNDYASSFWDYFNANWARYGGIPIMIDYTSLNKESISLDDLINSEADVLIISDAWGDTYNGWEYTDSEIQAIKEYVRSGHGIIATAGSFDTYSAPNNRKLADLFGMDPDIWYQWGSDGEQKSTNGPFELRTPRHSELWLNISDPYESAADITMYPEPTSDWTQQGITTGWLEAMTPDGLAAIITSEDVFHRSVYITTIPEESHNTNDEQLLYNAIIWTSAHAIVGDLNGDGKVSLADLTLLVLAYNSKPGDPNWNPAADLAAPYGIISLTDLVTMAMHYGQDNP